MGRSRTNHALLLAALCILALAAYANSFRAGLIVDNLPQIVNDPRVHELNSRNLDLILNRHYWFGNGESNLYRPLTTLSFLFNYAGLGDGEQPAGYHWINFALHCLNIALVYALLLALFHDVAAAWLTAAVWAVHPVLTESVTNVVGRADLLAGFAVLAGLLCHIAAGRASGRRRTFLLAALFLVSSVGIFSKESAIVLLGVMALYDLTIAPSGSWRRRAMHYAAAAAPVIVFLVLRARILARTLAYFIPFTDNPLVGADFWTSRLTAVKVIGKYLGLLVWPARMSSDYSYNQIPLFSWRAGSFEDWKAVIALLLCAALAIVAIRERRRRPQVAFFIGWFFVTLAPGANIFLTIGTIMAERFLYLPALALAACLILVLRSRIRGRAEIAVPAAIILAFAARTYARNDDWQSERSLIANAAESAPASFKPHMILTAIGEPADVQREVERTHAILDPLPDSRNSMKAYLNLGIAERDQGDRAGRGPEAVQWYEKSLRDLLRSRSISETVDRLMQEENLRAGKGKTNFGWFPVYMDLGRTYLRLSRPNDALEALEHGRLLEFRAGFFSEMSRAYQQLGDSRRAAVVLMEGMAIDTGQVDLAQQLHHLYQQTAPASCALASDGRGLNLQCPLVREELCDALANVAGLYERVGWRQMSEQTDRTRTADMGCPAR